MASYAQALFPDRWRCAGITLAPHTLGHALLLQRLSNPLAGRPTEAALGVGRGDLLQALMVCTRSWRQARAMIDSRAEAVWMAWRTLRLADRGIEAARVDFRAYLEGAWPVIDWWSPTQSNARSLGIDVLQALVARQRETGISLEAALDTPLAIAHWDGAAAAEREGTISICGEIDKAALDHYDQLVASGRLLAPGTKVDRKRN